MGKSGVSGSLIAGRGGKIYEAYCGNYDLVFRSGTPHNTSALSPSRNVEKLLDNGDIVVMPMAEEMTPPTTWKCIVINESILKTTIYHVTYPNGSKETIRGEVGFSQLLT